MCDYKGKLNTLQYYCDALVKIWMGTWVCGYGLYDPILVPTLPDGYDIFLFMYRGNFSHKCTANGFYLTGTRVMCTHCYPDLLRRARHMSMGPGQWRARLAR
jgi:hypothetical protein